MTGICSSLHLKDATVAQKRSLRYGNVPAGLSEHDQRRVDRFKRFLRYEMDDHEHFAYTFGEPMSSANDPSTYGMGC